MKIAILILALALPGIAQTDITQHQSLIDPGPSPANLQHQKADVDADIITLQKKPDTPAKRHELANLQNRSRILQNQITSKSKQPKPKG